MNFIIKIYLVLSCLLGMGAQAATNVVNHPVANGEYLVAIAQKFQDQFPGITWRSIASDNHLADPTRITVGQYLIIKAPKTLTAKVMVRTPAVVAQASAPRTEAKVAIMRNHGESIGCAKVFDGASFEERQVNLDNCARISGAQKQYAQSAQQARLSRVTQSRTPAMGAPEPAPAVASTIDPAVKAMIEEEFAQIRSELAESFSSAPDINITPLAWVILLKRHGVVPDARFAEQSLRIPPDDHLVVSTFPFDRLKE